MPSGQSRLLLSAKLWARSLAAGPGGCGGFTTEKAEKAESGATASAGTYSELMKGLKKRRDGVSTISLFTNFETTYISGAGVESTPPALFLELWGDKEM